MGPQDKQLEPTAKYTSLTKSDRLCWFWVSLTKQTMVRLIFQFILQRCLVNSVFSAVKLFFSEWKNDRNVLQSTPNQRLTWNYAECKYFWAKSQHKPRNFFNNVVIGVYETSAKDEAAFSAFLFLSKYEQLHALFLIDVNWCGLKPKSIQFEKSQWFYLYFQQILEERKEVDVKIRM